MDMNFFFFFEGEYEFLSTTCFASFRFELITYIQLVATDLASEYLGIL